MDAAELVGLLSAGPHATLLAVIAGDASWHIAEDWGLWSDWTATRVPVGLKFRRSTNGLVTQEVMVARASARERTAHARLLDRAQVPAHLVLVEGPRGPHNRLAQRWLDPRIGSDT
jgi:hypothetical protein